MPFPPLKLCTSTKIRAAPISKKRASTPGATSVPLVDPSSLANVPKKKPAPIITMPAVRREAIRNSLRSLCVNRIDMKVN